MKEFNYKSLKKIKRPVMLIVDDSGRFKGNKKSYRIRILFPDGTCIFNIKDRFESKWVDYTYSCFLRKTSLYGEFTENQNIVGTISEMEHYDSKNKFKVKKVIKL